MSSWSEYISLREKAIQSSLSNPKSALKVLCESAPSSLSVETKTSADAAQFYTKCAVPVFTALKESEYAVAVEQLASPAEIDAVLKMVYRAFEEKHPNAGSLLKLHAALLAKSGPGSIVRAFSDKSF
eukprot:ANDGO_02545.mRNA.1 hypothetical protein GUITHDRAFT_70882